MRSVILRMIPLALCLASAAPAQARAAPRIDGCSSAETTRCAPGEPRSAEATTALFASVPEAAKTTSGEDAPSARATWRRAASTAAFAACPAR